MRARAQFAIRDGSGATSSLRPLFSLDTLKESFGKLLPNDKVGHGQVGSAFLPPGKPLDRNRGIPSPAVFAAIVNGAHPGR